MSTRYYTIPPPPVLAPFVRSFWVFEHEVPPGEDYVYRSMADGCAELVFHYKGRFSSIGIDESAGPYHAYSLLHAQSQHYNRFLTRESFGIFGVYLYPFAIPRLFACSSPSVINHMIDLATFLGPEGKDLEEQIMLAPDNQQRARIMATFLQRQFNKYKHKETTIQTAVKHVIHTSSRTSVEQLSQQYNLSRRQFERKFAEYAGFSPKFYSRIIRFQAALQQYGGAFRSLTDIAYECGYYDQSHFIHDFKEFSGYHPGQYFRGRPEGIEYREGED